ncbi:hypothetical protein BKA63DRAFT_194180 [Paraphoma chrysanthemicola]|nr:hypothetical protein BKA63DRAFT_194180 [Paraphoma chrysanthemicola]
MLTTVAVWEQCGATVPYTERLYHFWRQPEDRMAPKTRSMTVEKGEKVSIADDPNPFSPLLSQPPISRSPTPTRSPASSRSPKSPAPPTSPTSSPPTSQISSPPLTLASDFITISSRINSYTNWPYQHLSPTKLAAAGFYHLFTDDWEEEEEEVVECAFCGIQHCYYDFDIPIKELMLDHEDTCSWPKLSADFYNHLPLITPPNTATPRTPNKNHTPTKVRTPDTPKKPPPSRIPRLLPKRNPIPLELPQPSNPQPPLQSPAHPPPPLMPPASPPQPRTYASVIASPPLTQPKPPHQTPPGPVLTVQDLITRFRNKPSPFQQQIPVVQHNPAITVTNSLSKFLLSALPAFTRFLSDMQGGQYIGHSPLQPTATVQYGRGPSNDTVRNRHRSA